MKYLRKFEKFDLPQSILIIVDVQKSFKKYFTDNYVESLRNLCNKYDEVYQIFDNHHEGKNVDKDYLYDVSPKVEESEDLYDFPNQKETIEKRYNYDVDADFYKKILDDDIHKQIKTKEDNLKKGEFFPTTEGTIIVYIGNNHKWFHVPKKLYELFKNLRQAQSENAKISIVGGADGECLDDIVTTCRSLGLKIDKLENFIYSASFCPIK
jgi:hypothetical protein